MASCSGCAILSSSAGLHSSLLQRILVPVETIWNWKVTGSWFEGDGCGKHEELTTREGAQVLEFWKAEFWNKLLCWYLFECKDIKLDSGKKTSSGPDNMDADNITSPSKWPGYGTIWASWRFEGILIRFTALVRPPLAGKVSAAVQQRGERLLVIKFAEYLLE